MPTNVEEVINSLILRIENDAAFRVRFRNALVRFSGNQDRGWLVMYYWVEIAYWSKVHQLEIIEDIDLAQIGDNLEKNRENFSNDRSWNGYQNVDGLWGDVRRLFETFNFQCKRHPSSDNNFWIG